jgi:hypothetical protein
MPKQDKDTKRPPDLENGQPGMVLPYPNPSLSEMAEEELRDGSVRSREAQSQTKRDAPPKKMALRQILLTIMCEAPPLRPPTLEL